jgi:hypothetical protein
MTAPSLPTGYDTTAHVQASRVDCHVTVGFDHHQQHIPRFLVQLHYLVETDPVRWEVIARMDHNETSNQGHDVYMEGLHVDVSRQSSSTVHLHVPHGPLPANRGAVIRACDQYLDDEAEYFIAVYEEQRPPGGPPRWSPDGGQNDHTFITPNTLPASMSQDTAADDTLTTTELSEMLAEVTGTTAEEIEHKASELDIAPPDEATVIEE